MPELPEVESSVLHLKSKVLRRAFVDIWSDVPKMGVLKGSLTGSFRDLIIGKKIQNIERRAKNIIFDLGDFSLLVHYKMTGHLLYGTWKKEKQKWISVVEGPLLDDKMNQHIRFIFFLDDKAQLAYCDIRKFGKIELWRKQELEEILSALGPEPLTKDFQKENFLKEIKKSKRMIKPLLLDQNFVSGIGNIYACEALWMAKIHPEKIANKLTKKEIFALYEAIKVVLKEAIEKRGDSMVDFRLPDGTKGNYQNHQKVYGKKDQNCPECGGKIKKIKVGGRGTYYCPNCQKL